MDFGLVACILTTSAPPLQIQADWGVVWVEVNCLQLGETINKVTSAQEKYLSSTWGSVELIQAVTGGGKFSNAVHLRTLSENPQEGKKDCDFAHKSRLKGLVRDIKGTDKRLLLHAKITSAWLSVRGTIVSGTVLSAT